MAILDSFRVNGTDYDLRDNSKVAIWQGTENADMALVVGPDGNTHADDVSADHVIVESGGTYITPDYSMTRTRLTGTVTNNATWTESGSVSQSGEMYARYNNIGEYEIIYVTGGLNQNNNKPLCVFYSSSNAVTGAIYTYDGKNRNGVYGASIAVPANSSYVMVNGLKAGNNYNAVQPDVYAASADWDVPTYANIQGVFHAGAAWHSVNKKESSGSNYCYTRYDDFNGHKKIYVTGISYGNNYPVAAFYDDQDAIIGSYIEAGMFNVFAMELEVPNNASYLMVNGWQGQEGLQYPNLQYILPQRTGVKSTQTVSECFDNVNQAIEALEEKANKGRKILFVGDSYAEGYSHDGNNSGWCRYAAGYMGLSTDDYKIVYTGGYAFNNGTFTSLLANVQDTDITDVIVCGGFNDRNATSDSIRSGISAFKTAVESKWPGARVFVGFVAYIKAGTGESAKADWEDIRVALMEKVLPAYQDCIRYGCRYLNNVEYWINDDGLTPTDGYHPSAEGNANIGKAVANAFRCGAAPLFYDEALRLGYVASSGVTDEIKTALINLAQRIAYTDEQGAACYRALYGALYPDAFPCVEAVFEPSTHVVYAGDALSTLKPYLTVTYYETATSAGMNVTNYQLSGTLVAGSNTVTVSYNGLTDTISVEALDVSRVLYALPEPTTFNGTEDDMITADLHLLAEDRSYSVVCDVEDWLIEDRSDDQRMFRCTEKGFMLHANYSSNRMYVQMQFNGGNSIKTYGVSLGSHSVRVAFSHQEGTQTWYMRMKVDGVEATAGTGIGVYTLITNDSPLSIGGSINNAGTIKGSYVKCTVNEFVIYDYAMSQSEIDAYMEG